MKAQRYTPGQHDTRENPQASGGRDRGTELVRRLRATSVTTLDRVTDWMGSHARGLPSAVRLSFTRTVRTSEDGGRARSCSDESMRRRRQDCLAADSRRLQALQTLSLPSLPPRRCAYTTPIRLSGRPKPLKPTRDGPSRGTPPQLQHHRRRRVVHRPRALCRVQVPRWAG